MPRRTDRWEERKLFRSFSSRIANLYIQLPEYEFFHGPSGLEAVDKRFVGRDEVIRKIQRLLTDFSVSSGAYLVTGYRGAGKSSAVATALSTLSGQGTPARSTQFMRIFIWASVLVILGAIPNLVWQTLLFLGTTLLLVVSLRRLAPDSDQSYRQNSPQGRFASLVETLCGWTPGHLLSTLLLTRDEKQSDRLRSFLLDTASAIALFLAISISLILFFSTAQRLGYDCPPFVGVLIHIGILTTFRFYSVKRRLSRPSQPADNVRGLFGLLKRKWRGSNRMVIRINLSQDDIKEIDILRLLVTNLLSAYRRYLRSTNGILAPLTGALLTFSGATFVYNIENVHQLTNSFKLLVNLPMIAPSQGEFLLSKTDPPASEYLSQLDRALNDRSSIQSLRKNLAVLAGRDRQEFLLRHDEGTHEIGDLLAKLGAVALDLTAHADAAVQLSYSSVVTYLFGIQDKAAGAVLVCPPLLRPGAYVVPALIDYVYLLYLGLVAWFAKWALDSGLTRWETNKRIIGELDELSEMVEAQVTRDSGTLTTPVSTLVSFNFGRKRSQTFQQLSARDIEKRLLDIMQRIKDLPPFSRRPSFIIIFDELDKIHHSSAEVQSQERSSASIFSSVEAERERQHRVLKLVSNLKYFLTTAPAKFIFIAGREMFDASLADVSDRHFFMGSVFHEVIHVPSFHRDPTDDRLPDLTSLTEEYVVRMLLPTDDWPEKDRLSLHHYGEYLDKKVLTREYYSNATIASSGQKGGSGDSLRRAFKEKVMYELRNFVIYLTYRSNGAPKKMTQGFERYIVGREEKDLDQDRLEIGDGSQRTLFLRFVYEDQYAFGLIAYLASPLLFSLSREMKDYGDKILVSSSFLLDHIYKFHGMGFSWRNLELLPEIVDASRAPQLRGLVRRLVAFLGRSDLARVDNGLYDFKFTRRVSEEISLLSRISEFESAAFNFTLDESMALKHHFQQKLESLVKLYGVYPNKNRKMGHVHSLAFLRMVLGDLHFYDGDLDNAIIEYMEAVQSFRGADLSQFDLSTMLLMCRNFLKLALSYERKQSISSALSVYTKLIEAIGRYVRVVRMQPDPGALGARKQTAEDIDVLRILYLPMLAKLHLLEKLSGKGLGSRDIKSADDEFRALFGGRTVEYEVNEQVFSRKLGNILFLKNGPRDSEIEGPSCQTPQSTCRPNRGWEELVKQRRLPCSACARFSASITGRPAVEESGSPDQGEGVAVLRIFAILDMRNRHTCQETSASLAAFAETLAYQGDCFVSCASMGISEEASEGDLNLADLLAPLIEVFARILQKTQAGKHIELSSDDRIVILECAGKNVPVSEQSPRFKLAEACCYYLASAAILGLASRYREAKLEVVKSLWLIRESISLARSSSRLSSRGKVLKSLKKGVRELVAAGVRLAYRCHEGTHRLEIEYLKEMVLGELNVSSAVRNPVNLGRLSINVSIGEILVLGDEIRHLLSPRTKPIPIDQRCSPFGMIHSAYTRIQELRLRLLINRHNFRFLCSSLARGERTVPVSSRSSKLALRERRSSAADELRRDFEKKRQDIERAFEKNQKKAAQALEENQREAARAFEQSQGLKIWAAEFRFRPAQARPKDEPSKVIEDIFTTATPQPSEAIEFVLLDSLYCCHETVRMMSIFGSSYISSFSMRASAHRSFAWWCDVYFEYWKLLLESGMRPEAEQLVRSVRDHLGSAEMVVLSPNFHREMAKSFYAKSLEAHSEGDAYKDRIQDTFFLWDDCADHLEHFCAALERLRINSGYMDRKLEDLDRDLMYSQVSEVDQYLYSGFTEKSPPEDPPDANLCSHRVGTAVAQAKEGEPIPNSPTAERRRTP